MINNIRANHVTRYVFDMDGTLLDSRRALVEAYRAAGLEDPETMVSRSRPIVDQITPAQHRKKAEVYPEYLARYAKALPLYGVAIDRRGPFPLYVLTGASEEAVRQINEIVLPDLLRCFRVVSGMCPEAKAEWLNLYSSGLGATGVYVDDDERARGIIRRLTRWEVISPRQALRRLLTDTPRP